jgi:hypothetical protein
MKPVAETAKAFYERRLPPDEARAYIEAPMTPEEREDLVALIRWFRRRYPTPLERLTYARKTYNAWMRTSGIADI